MKAVSTLVWFILVLQTLPAQTPNLPLDPIAPATSEVPIKYSLPDDTPADLPQAAKPDAGAGLAGPCSNYDILQCGQTLYGQTNFGFGNDPTLVADKVLGEGEFLGRQFYFFPAAGAGLGIEVQFKVGKMEDGSC